jgi:hypothetical protein
MLYALNDQGGNGADESPAVAPIASAIATAKASSIFVSSCPIVPPAVTLERTCVSAGCIVDNASVAVAVTAAAAAAADGATAASAVAAGVAARVAATVLVLLPRRGVVSSTVVVGGVGCRAVASGGFCLATYAVALNAPRIGATVVACSAGTAIGRNDLAESYVAHTYQ